MLWVGQRIDRYVVEDYLGHGGMAVVYRVRHERLGSTHALKVLTATRPGVSDRLLREGRAQASLKHPNVIAVTDVIEVDKSLALVMEYADGPTLEFWLRLNGPATPQECFSLLHDICAGVGEAHRMGFVHRDLKPANVLLARSGAAFVPQVADFGIAKLFGDPDSARSTQTLQALGTPHYMAPEQIRDARHADARADLFSIGALIYEAATGHVAFEGPDVLGVLNAVNAVDYVPPQERVPGLPKELVAVIEGCLKADPDDRLRGCEAILELIRHAPRVPLTRGFERPNADYQDDASIAARKEWLDTATPANQRQPEGDETVTPAPHTDTLPEPAEPIDDLAATVPRPDPRASLPPSAREIPVAAAVGSQRPLLGLIAILVAVLLVLGGTVVFIVATGWSQRPSTPPAAPPLGEVVAEPRSE